MFRNTDSHTGESIPAGSFNPITCTGTSTPVLVCAFPWTLCIQGKAVSEQTGLGWAQETPSGPEDTWLSPSQLPGRAPLRQAGHHCRGPHFTQQCTDGKQGTTTRPTDLEKVSTETLLLTVPKRRVGCARPGHRGPSGEGLAQPGGWREEERVGRSLDCGFRRKEQARQAAQLSTAGVNGFSALRGLGLQLAVWYLPCR